MPSGADGTRSPSLIKSENAGVLVPTSSSLNGVSSTGEIRSVEGHSSDGSEHGLDVGKVERTGPSDEREGVLEKGADALSIDLRLETL